MIIEQFKLKVNSVNHQCNLLLERSNFFYFCLFSFAGFPFEKGGIYCELGFLGHKDLAPVYASADVHVSCSQFETLGNTVLEAHASGTSVVVPRTQGFVDTVEHEVN